jgi:hypothetical protein
MEALLAALSAPFYAEHQFPPADYQVPEGYAFYS